MTASPHLEPPSYAELLEAQSLVLSRRQALTGGLSDEALEWRVGRGRWQTVLPGVVVAHSGEPTFLQRVWAATLYGGVGAAVSGDALVHLLSGRGDAPERIDVAVRPDRQVAANDFFRPHRCNRLDELRHPVRSPPQLRIAPAVLHSVAWAKTDRAAEWRLAAAVQRRLVPLTRLRDALVQLPRLPRRGLVRVVLDDVELGAHAGSELAFLRFLRRHGLPLPDRLQYKVRANGKRYLDAWWEGQRVAVEIDGAHHMGATAWDEDALRANAIVIAARADRIVPLRVTTGNLRHAEAELAAQLRVVLLG